MRTCGRVLAILDQKFHRASNRRLKRSLVCKKPKSRSGGPLSERRVLKQSEIAPGRSQRHGLSFETRRYETGCYEIGTQAGYDLTRQTSRAQPHPITAQRTVFVLGPSLRKTWKKLAENTFPPPLISLLSTAR